MVLDIASRKFQLGMIPVGYKYILLVIAGTIFVAIV